MSAVLRMKPTSTSWLLRKPIEGAAAWYSAATKRFSCSLFITLLLHAFIFIILLGANPATMTRVSGVSNEVSRLATTLNAPLTIVALANDLTADSEPLLKLTPAMVLTPTTNTNALLPSPVVSGQVSPAKAGANDEVSVDASWQALYQRTSNLQKSPQPLTDITPTYPKQAGKMRGKVGLLLFISEFGDVDRVVVTYATPRGLFEASAIEAFQQAKFLPGTALGIPVKSQLALEILFSPFTQE